MAILVRLLLRAENRILYRALSHNSDSQDSYLIIDMVLVAKKWRVGTTCECSIATDRIRQQSSQISHCRRDVRVIKRNNNCPKGPNTAK
jgi:hypothetical protein